MGDDYCYFSWHHEAASKFFCQKFCGYIFSMRTGLLQRRFNESGAAAGPTAPKAARRLHQITQPNCIFDPYFLPGSSVRPGAHNPPGKGCAPGRLREGVRADIRMMDRPQIEAAVIVLLITGGSATFTALMLGYVAHYDFGLSRQEIRTPAMLGAAAIAVLIAVEFFGKELRKP